MVDQPVFQLRIQLEEVVPAVWRRLLVPGGVRLPKLHDMFQAGGMAPRTSAVDGRVEVRDILDLTVSIDHNVVDGAPAVRFGAALRELLETAEVLASDPHPNANRETAPRRSLSVFVADS